jgi:hypothetical protein
MFANRSSSNRWVDGVRKDGLTMTLLNASMIAKSLHLMAKADGMDQQLLEF